MPESEKESVLFSEFTAVTAAGWAEKVRQDLKGEDPESLHWQTAEGLVIKPCYHPEDIAGNPFAKTQPGQYPLVRGPKTTTNNWENTQEIPVGDDATAAIDRGARALTQGADGLHFYISQPQIFDTAYLLKTIDVTHCPVSFTVTEQPAAFTENLLQQLSAQNIPFRQLRGYIHYNPATAEKYTPAYFDKFKNLVQISQGSPDFYGVTVNGAYIASAGGTIVQEIGFTISAAVAYLAELTNRGLAPETVAQNMQLRVAVGTNYFFEIAKLRAIRLLWANVIQAYGLSSDLAAALRLHSVSSSWYQTTFDPHSNLLRATTQGMAAIIGGCDSLTVSPFDITIRPENEFSERLARNLSLILKEEAYLHQSIDPAAGSYYLETLTLELAEAAWHLFQKLETQGGFGKAWSSNYINNALHQVAQQKFKNIAAGKDVLVGTNKFINPQEKMDYNPEALIQSNYFDTTRAAYSFEVMRFAAEMHYRKKKQKPKAIIVSIGEAIQRHMNASFAKEFFTCAGFDTETQHFTSVAAAKTALHQVSADVIIMSASENEYATFAQHFGPALRTHPDQPALVLAANPRHMKAELKEQGFDEFLFQGCDTTAIVARIQERLSTRE